MSQPTPQDDQELWAYEYWMRGLYDFNYLTVRQKILSIAQRYYVTDQSGGLRFYVVRPTKPLGYTFANVASLITSLSFLYFAITALFQGQFLTAGLLFVGGGYAAGLLRTLLIPYRDIYVYTDENEHHQVMLISQDNKFGLYHRFTIHDHFGQPIATAKRNFFIAIFRRRWVAETLDGRPICRIIEDTLALSVIRRYLGPLLGFLRTNFDIELPNGTQVGEYNRSLTLYDQYVLDVAGDPQQLIDRRVLLAAAILLDTGEGR